MEKLVLEFIGTSPSHPSPVPHHIRGDGDERPSHKTDCKESQSSTEEHLARKPQVISLGAGKDSLFFRLMDRGTAASGGYFEVDFPAVSRWKGGLVAKTPILSALANDSYKLVAADLRDITALEDALIMAGVDLAAPTIFLAECVLVYMEPAESGALLQWCASKFPDSLFAAYEMTSPHDAFGKMMKQNIQRMGCLLPGLEPYPSLLSQEERFKKSGWDSANAIDMLQVFQVRKTASVLRYTNCTHQGTAARHTMVACHKRISSHRRVDSGRSNRYAPGVSQGSEQNFSHAFRESASPL
ncbi:unnamed protein product [Ectocarpus sp. 12 AP-2014]